VLISLKEIVLLWRIRPNGVLHIGAHEAEEKNSYDKYQWSPVTWIEAQPDLASNLRKTIESNSHKVISAAVWDSDGVELELKITSNSQSSSLFDLGTHASDYPNIVVINKVKVKSARIDSIFNSITIPNFINLDIQGAELNALKGFGALIKKVDFIYTEINRREVYLGCTLYIELCEYLNAHGFKCVTQRWVLGKGWGDALFVRPEQIKFIKLKMLISSVFTLSFYLPQVTKVSLMFLRDFFKPKN
jgi:FkbM family methyltransferase